VDLSALSAGQLDVFGHDGDSQGVDGAQVGVLANGCAPLLSSSVFLRVTVNVAQRQAGA